MRRWAIAWLFPLLLAGCTTTLPPVRYPDLADEGTPAESLCIVREADHCFVGSVDEAFIAQFDVNPINPGTYRQLLLPPGEHVLAVYYRWQRNLDTVSSGPRHILIHVAPGERYVLQANVVGADAAYADMLRTANWRPSVVDQRTGRQVAIAPVNR